MRNAYGTLIIALADVIKSMHEFLSSIAIRLFETMNVILSPSFFVQFGSSALVLCSAAYMLSVVSTIELCVQPTVKCQYANDDVISVVQSAGWCNQIHQSGYVYLLRCVPNIGELLLWQSPIRWKWWHYLRHLWVTLDGSQWKMQARHTYSGGAQYATDEYLRWRPVWAFAADLRAREFIRSITVILFEKILSPRFVDMQSRLLVLQLAAYNGIRDIILDEIGMFYSQNKLETQICIDYRKAGRSASWPAGHVK